MAGEDEPIIVEAVEEPLPPGRNWRPTVGAETLDFLRNVVPEPSRDGIRDAAVTILAKGIPPAAAPGQETGLVVGYVQSGKTMSFETVAALARDNAFKIVIVVAGTSTPLLEQSTGRLRRDLRLDDAERARHWIPFQNPGDADNVVQAIRDVLD